MTSNLKKKAISGVVWTLSERFGMQGIQFVIGVILARLLSPCDYGLIGMITVFFVVAGVFVQSGFGMAYVQKKNVTDLDANTVFYTNLLSSIVLYFCIWIIAPSIARFYNQPVLIHLTRVTGIVVIINAFNIIQTAQLTRDVDFKRSTRVILISTLFSGVSGMTAAYMGMGVWSLVIQQLSNRFLTTVGLWFTSQWRPGLQFSLQSYRSLFSFGVWVLAADILRAVFDNIYILTIGKFFPVAQLGYYTNAKKLQKMASEEIAGSIGRVAFPVLAKMQENKFELKNGARKFLKYTMFITVPIMVTLIVVAKPFVLLMLTEKWAPMTPYIQLLCIVGLLFPIHLINVKLLQAQGRSNLNFKIAAIKNLLRISNIAIIYRFGVIFIILGEVVLSFIALLINTHYTKQLADYGVIEQFKDIGFIFSAGALACLSGYVVTCYISNLYINFCVGLLATISGYLFFQYVLNRQFLNEILKLKEVFTR